MRRRGGGRLSWMAVLMRTRVMGKGPMNQGANLGLLVRNEMSLDDNQTSLPDSVRSLEQCLSCGNANVFLFLWEDGRLVA